MRELGVSVHCLCPGSMGPRSGDSQGWLFLVPLSLPLTLDHPTEADQSVPLGKLVCCPLAAGRPLVSNAEWENL